MAATALLLMVAVCSLPGAAKADFNDFGIASATAELSTAEAGGHPNFTTTINFKTDPASVADGKGRHRPYANVKDISVALPPGLVGNPNAVLTCSLAQFVEAEFATPENPAGCPQDAQVGVVVLESYFNETPIVAPLFNLKSPAGDTVARLGTRVLGFQTLIDVHVRSDGDYGITASSTGITPTSNAVSLTTNIWGVPADHSHDTLRLTPLEASQGATESPPRASGLVPAPFMTNPTRCGAPLSVAFGATNYQLPGAPRSTAVAALPKMTGCGKLSFQPKLTALPTTRAAASPSGIDADLTIPQDESIKDLATSQLRYATVSLPEGVTIAPGAADGLAACSAEEVGLGTVSPAACPAASKIGSAEFDVPALSRVIDGSIYQRTPVKGNLFGIWLVTDELGVHVKIPGEVHPDPSTGRLTTTFVGTPATEGNPQVPLREFKLHFKGGSRGVLATPAACGTYQTEYRFTPWSGTADVAGSTPMTIDHNCNTHGFKPKLSAGSTNPSAGAFSPFVTDVVRESNEQNISGLEVTLPPGVLAKLAGVTLCTGPATETGACPAASRVGSTTVASGPGSTPLWIPQPGKEPTAVYLSGPYRGAPYSLVVKAPAQAGPFDLGTVVVRAAIAVDPETTKVSVKSDPLPQILEGVPISYRTVHVEIDRRQFVVNPTNCDPLRASGLATSNLGAVASLSDRFQAVGCDRLGFKPKLAMRLFGKTRRGGHPRFRAVLTTRRGDANIGRAVVALPHSEFLDQSHIGTVCTRVQFAAEECPAASVYGSVKATTPLLDRPLKGPVYLRSSSHKLPDLVADLKGQVEVVLAGRIDSVNGGIRTSFEAVPDAPVERFELNMRGGKRGLLENSQNICKSPRRATVKLDGQNGRFEDFRSPLGNNCSNRIAQPGPRG